MLIGPRVTQTIAQEEANGTWSNCPGRRILERRMTGPRVPSAFGSAPQFPVFASSHTRVIPVCAVLRTTRELNLSLSQVDTLGRFS